MPAIVSAVPAGSIIDRRSMPSHGYRAVHVVSTLEGRAVEVQVRTKWQHFWAEGSEKLADTLGSGIKYGVGPADVLQVLQRWSEAIAEWEPLENAHVPVHRRPHFNRVQARLNEQFDEWRSMMRRFHDADQKAGER